MMIYDKIESYVGRGMPKRILEKRGAMKTSKNCTDECQ